MKDLGNPTVGSVHLQLFCLSVIRVPWSYPLCVIRLDIRGGGKFENMWGASFVFLCMFWAFLLETVCSSNTRSFEILMEQVLILIWPKWVGGQTTPCPPESAGPVFTYPKQSLPRSFPRRTQHTRTESDWCNYCLLLWTDQRMGWGVKWSPAPLNSPALFIHLPEAISSS